MCLFEIPGAIMMSIYADISWPKGKKRPNNIHNNDGKFYNFKVLMVNIKLVQRKFYYLSSLTF